MSEVMPNTPQEFWSPPVARPEHTSPSLAAACRNCGTEFMVGARFCHVCGAARRSPLSHEPYWTHVRALLSVLEFQTIKAWLGLPTASLVAFLMGMGCVLAAIAVGVFYSVQTLADFQAIQLWRIEWLLAALAAFVAGILLKRTKSAEK
jgi:hypothetical protein